MTKGTILKYEYYDCTGRLDELSFFEFPKHTTEEVKKLHQDYQNAYTEYRDAEDEGKECQYDEQDVNTFDHWLNFMKVEYKYLVPDLTITD